jgi:hypothetical protein
MLTQIERAKKLANNTRKYYDALAKKKALESKLPKPEPKPKPKDEWNENMIWNPKVNISKTSLNILDENHITLTIEGPKNCSQG